jgi:hypothetical protein
MGSAGSILERFHPSSKYFALKGATMKRKDFWAIGVLGLLGLFLTLGGAACSSSTTPSNTTTSQTFTSTSVQSHTHTVTIQKTEVDSPPSGGISRQTSTSGGHSHTFTMTQDQLNSVKNGASVQIETSVDSSHSHSFTIAKWY